MLQKGDMHAQVRILKMVYAHTLTHISENFPAPICSKIARTHTKGLVICYVFGILSSL